MSMYRYKNAALIDCVEITSPRVGLTQATLTAVDKADGTALETLREKLGAGGYSSLMDTKDGRPVIQVRGIKDEEHFVEFLEKLDLAKNGVEKDLTRVDHTPSFSEKVRGKSLFLSALFYDLGNAAFVVSGIQRGKHNPDGKMTPNDRSEMMIGLSFGLGDLLMTFYGSAKGDEELQAAATGLRRHLQKKGIELPEGNVLNPDTLHQSGAVKATDRWLRKHIGQVKCFTETIAGLFTIHSAMKPGNVNHSKLAGGFLITAGWLATLLMDKPRGDQIFSPDKPPSTILDSMSAIPRGTIAGPAAMFNNGLTLWGALNPKDGERVKFRKNMLEAQEKVDELSDFQLNTLLGKTPEDVAGAQKNLARLKASQHDFIWNVASSCCFLVANTLFSMSGAKRPSATDDDKRMSDDLVLLSANVLAKQSPQAREALVGEMAEYVSKLAHVKMTKDQIAEAIHDKVERLPKSPWASRVQPAAAATAPHITM